MRNQALDISGAELLDSDVYSQFNGGDLMEDFHGGDYFDVTGEKKSNFTAKESDYTDAMFDEYDRSGSKKKFKDWLENDSSLAMYEKSGKKKPFKEWLSQDSTGKFLGTIATLGNAFMQGKNYDKTNDNATVDKGDSSDKKIDEEKKILGMTPVNFGIAVTAFAVLVIGTTLLIYKSKSK